MRSISGTAKSSTRDTGDARMPFEELGRIVYFRGDTLPKGLPRELVQTRHYITSEYPFAFTNGVQASYLEVDTDTGIVTLLKHWCVEDCGRIINPQLVDEQIRGGIVQGLGGALFEEIHYDDGWPAAQRVDGRLPCADGGGDAGHGHWPCRDADQGKHCLARRARARPGTAGAPAAVMNAINDALRPLGAQVTDMPFTPERILRALGAIDD